ncbi:hypothetical protein F4782DRAFT_511795 [Xylaria castorea]|nr:hypothetical protein F4782DRAFT_511795 [Xylaria castorea]
MIQFDSSKQTCLRRACNRCHQSKLKCSKEIDEDKCQRCLRADVECTFSPPASTQRRQTWSVATLATSETRYRGREPASTTDLINDIFDADLAQPDSSFYHVGGNARCLYPNGDPDLGTAWPSALEFADYSIRLPEGDIFMALDECENSPVPAHETSVSSNSLTGVWRPHQIPSRRTSPGSGARSYQTIIRSTSTSSSTHVPPIYVPPIYVTFVAKFRVRHSFKHQRKSSRQKKEAKSTFAVDQALHLSQLFIDILGSICLKLPASDKGGDQVTNKPGPASFRLDPSAELLIFSAYLRLLGTYHRILESIQAAAKQNHLQRSTAATFQLPSLTVGSFSLSSKSNTQSLVLVNLTETLAMRARGLITEMSSPKITPGYRGDFQSFGGVSLVIVPDLALRAIRAREDALSRMIDDLKTSIL